LQRCYWPVERRRRNEERASCHLRATRNYFALDLRIDVDGVASALVAFVDGGERRIDLGRVNGRLFVCNNPYGVDPRPQRRTRGDLDGGVLGVIALIGPPPRGLTEWSTPTFRCGSRRSSAAPIAADMVMIIMMSSLRTCGDAGRWPSAPSRRRTPWAADGRW